MVDGGLCNGRAADDVRQVVSLGKLKSKNPILSVW